MRKMVFLLAFFMIFSGCCSFIGNVAKNSSNNQTENPANRVILIPIINNTECPSPGLQIFPNSTQEVNDTVKGYRLYWNGKLMIDNKSWNAYNAVDNFRWNMENNKNKNVTAFFDGEPIPYLTSIDVLPVFFVPADAPDPTQDEIQRFQEHLNITQNRYKELLHGRDTFTIAPASPLVYHSPHNVSYFTLGTDGRWGKLTSELLSYMNVTRFSLSHVLVVIFMNPYDDWPGYTGATINGGFNMGAGMVRLPSSHLADANSTFQTTLEHELGHAFGLVHPDAYGYNLTTNPSVMSYDDRLWHGFQPPEVDRIFIPEDIYELSRNKLAFPHLYFNASEDVPPGYVMHDKGVVGFGPANLSTDWSGYEFFLNGVMVRQEQNWSLKDSIVNFIEMSNSCSGESINATYGGYPIFYSGQGYELYSMNDLDTYGVNERAASNWTVGQAVDNFLNEKKAHPDGTAEIVGIYDRQLMIVNTTNNEN
jgi:hypothetical protein